MTLAPEREAEIREAVATDIDPFDDEHRGHWAWMSVTRELLAEIDRLRADAEQRSVANSSMTQRLCTQVIEQRERADRLEQAIRDALDSPIPGEYGHTNYGRMRRILRAAVEEKRGDTTAADFLRSVRDIAPPRADEAWDAAVEEKPE